jgi:hypothetical protein
MATESSLGKCTFEVSGIAADWTCSYPIEIVSVVFRPSAANDVLRIQERVAGTTSDPGFTITSLDGGEVGWFWNCDGAKIKPWVDFSECTFSNAANVKITFTIRP